MRVFVHMDYTRTKMLRKARSKLCELRAGGHRRDSRNPGQASPFGHLRKCRRCVINMVHVRGIGLDSGGRRPRALPCLSLPRYCDLFFLLAACCVPPHFVSFFLSLRLRWSFRSRIALLQIEMKLFCAQRRKSLNCPHDPRLSLSLYIVVPHILRQVWNKIAQCFADKLKCNTIH